MKLCDTQIVVAGAGIAGLAAARCLAEAGLRVTLVEAREHVGGRLMSFQFLEQEPGKPQSIELGAEFIHGRPADLLALIREAGLDLVETEGVNYCEENGRICACPENNSFKVIDELENYCGNDMSFTSYVHQAGIPREDAEQAINYVEGFNAANAQDISILALGRQQAAEAAIEGDRSCHLAQGYSALAEYVHQRFRAAGGETRCNTHLLQVTWQKRQALLLLQSEGGPVQQITAKRVVVTLPLGVLQSGKILFQPRPAFFDDLHALAMGPVLRLSMVFKERFWVTRPNPCSAMSFLFTPRKTPGVWWTRSLTGAPILTAWIGGIRTQTVEPASLLSRALSTLHHVFDIPEANLRAMLSSFHFHDWNSDPLSMGAYSYVRDGGLPASERLSRPVEETLYFAGEHTDTSGHWGTVHGALRSGIRAAQQILASRNITPTA